MRIALPAQTAHDNLHVMAVVREQDDQPDQHENGITRKDACLEHADRVAERTREPACKVDEAIDNPLVPPHRNSGKDAREPSGTVDT